LIICCLITFFWEKKETVTEQVPLPQITIESKLLEPNKYSRPQIELKKVKGIVVHYTANPGTDAIDNRNYFNNLPNTNKGKKNPTYASSHFIVGLEGQIIQCVPLDEIAYASNDRNSDTISIECCHPNKSGKFNKATYQALKELVLYLCIKYDLSADDVIRHYDVTGKLCPLYFVKHEDKWLSFKSEIENMIEKQKELSE
jgi:N-acetylmuramoyl-L-alanine amidase CwlA